MESSLCQFSPEVLEKIFQFLQPEDLCALAQTNRKVGEAASNPEFFSKLGQSDSLKAKIVEKGMARFLAVPRLRNIRGLDLSFTTLPLTDYDMLMSHINNGWLKKLEVLRLSETDKSGINQENLANAAP